MGKAFDIFVSQDNASRSLYMRAIEHSRFLLDDNFYDLVKGHRCHLGLGCFVNSTCIKDGVVLVNLACVEDISPSEAEKTIS
jgi:hypothetical protein